MSFAIAARIESELNLRTRRNLLHPMEVHEILANPEIAVRVCGYYGPLLVVVKVFDTNADRSIKFYEKPERYDEVKATWKTNVIVPCDQVDGAEYIRLAQCYLSEITTAIVKQR